MELSQHVTYAQYSLLNSNEVMNCNAEPASPPDTKSPRVFYFSYFRANVAFAKSSLAFGAGDSHVRQSRNKCL